MKMLEYINFWGFTKYGSLLQPGDARLAPEAMLELAGSDAFYRCAAPVVLAPGEGMAVLQLVCDEQTAEFYMDKPVELLPGVQFAVVSIDGPCAVRYRASMPLQREPELRARPLPLLQPKISVRQICTIYLQEHGPGFFFAGERHRPYELAYVSHGALHVLSGGQELTLRQNEAMIIPPDCWHVQFGGNTEPCSFLVATFFCAQPLPQTLLLRKFPERRTTTELMRGLARQIDTEQPYQADLLITALQALLVRYATDAAGTQSETVPIPSTLKGENQIISRAVEYVAEHTGERITVTELARVCCVSPAYLSLLFQRHLGSAPGAYMLRVRLERSRQMIRSGAGSMAQIAQALCFSSAQHFSTAFKRQYGVSPKEYAKGLK
ncbi:MAG: helix-turn-helix domain-containing protein [Oscillospiraceae bacterium]